MPKTRPRWLRRLIARIVLMGGVALVPNLAAAQTQEATIFGQVTDQSGAVLPGVTVTISSPALLVKQVVEVTNESGEYRATPLPLGMYTVEYTLGGFQTLRREGLRLTAGFVAKVDVALKIGELEESVTVSGVSPVVDVKTTSAGTQLTREVLQAVPTGRDGLTSLLTLGAGTKPGLDFGQSTTDDPFFRAFGRSNNAWILVDGAATTAAVANSGHANTFNYESVEEAAVQTLGSSAESPTSGVQISIIWKSGGNNFHGGGFVSQFAPWMQSNNIDDALRAQGINDGNKTVGRYDRSGELGGRLIRDKLWFYGTARQRYNANAVLDLYKPDGSPALNSQIQKFLVGKLTYQLSPSQKLIASDQWESRDQDGGPNLTRLSDYDSRGVHVAYVSTGKVEWQLAKGNKFVSLLAGYYSAPAGPYPSLSDKPSTFDQVTRRNAGAEVAAGRINDYGRYDSRGTLNWFKPSLFLGGHDFKTGYNYTMGREDSASADRGALIGNYQLVYRSGVPFQLVANNNPVNPVTSLHYLGAFVQDSWAIDRRFTLNLGLRYGHDNGYLKEQCRVTAPAPFETLYAAQCFPAVQFNIWHSVQPRLHAAYDVTGDGKTVIKGGWGRFAVMRAQEELNTANNNTASGTTFRWTDLNGDRLYQPGEVNLDPNGPDFVSRQVSNTGIFSGMVPNLDQQGPGSDELSLSLERQLMPNFSLRVTGVYSKNFNTVRVLNTLRPYDAYNIPITNPDPGPDNIVGNADDPGTSITYYDYPAALRGNAFQQPMFVNDPGSDANYKSVELAGSKRMSDRWQLLVSYSATKSHIPFEPDLGQDIHTALNPNSEIFAANNTWEWLTRVSGSYLFPAEIQLSANYMMQSGDPWARTVSFTGGQQIPSITLRVEPIGSRRAENVSLLTVRAEKSFRIVGQHKVSVRAQIYNALNANFVKPAQNGRTLFFETQSGASFMKPTQIAIPRIGEIQFAYAF